jgi:tyrosine aminotransferase
LLKTITIQANEKSMQVHEAILNLSQLILGPCSIIQAALPDILHNTPQEFHDKTIAQLEVGHKIES